MGTFTSGQPIIDPRDGGRFGAVCVALASTLDTDMQLRIAAFFITAKHWRELGLELPWSRESIMGQLFYRVVIQHMYEGRPLAFTPEMIRGFEALADGPETVLDECGGCGIVLPPSGFTACPLCGCAEIGYGAYARRRARLAGNN